MSKQLTKVIHFFQYPPLDFYFFAVAKEVFSALKKICCILCSVLEKRCIFAQIYLNAEQFIINHLITFIAMRKLFTLLTLCLLAGTALAGEIVFDPTTDVGTFGGSAGAFSVSKDGVTISISNGTIATASNITAYRIYKGQTATFSSTVGEISEVKFECTASGDAQYGPGCFTANVGTYTFADKVGTWTGANETIVFTASLNQVRASKIIVTVGDAGLVAPVIKPAGGTFFDPVEVTITCPTQGAKIYYTTNGSNPTASSTQYTGAFTLNQNTTVKAVSVKDGETSAVVTAEFVFSSERIGLGALGSIADDTQLVLGYDATVLKQAGTTMYVKDETGYGLIYGTVDQKYEQGDVIAKGYGGLKVTYNAEPELKNPTGFTPKSGHVDLTPETITCSQVGHTYWAHYVKFNNATISMTDANNGTLSDASGSCPIYNKTFGIELPTDGKPYNVLAIVASYQQGGQGDPVYQVLPVYIEGFEPTPPPGSGLGDLPNVPDNTTVTLEYDATVIWQGGNNNNYLYLKDATGFGLVYGGVGQTYHIGDVIPKGYSGKKTTYKGEPELASPAGFKAASGTAALTPETITTAGVNHGNWAHYVLIKNAKLSADGKQLTDAAGTCEFYNGTFNIKLPEDGAAHDWYGIVGVFSNYQFLPLSYDVAPTPPEPEKPVPVLGINELYSLEKDKQGQFTTPLTAIYQNGPRMYVQDAEGVQTLVYGTVPGEFVNGDLIVDAIAKWSEYQGAKQMVPVENFVPAGKGTEVEPDEPMPIEEISQDMVHRYLSFEDVYITEEDGKIYIVDETGRIQLFDQFGVVPEDLDYSVTHYVEGFLTVYKGELEFYPILIDGGDPDCGIKGDVNNDKEINIADINALLDIILGASADECTRWRADMNGDGEIGLADVNALSDNILSH